MNKYQVAKNFIERNVNYNHIKKLFPDMDEMNLSLDYFQELLDNYSKLYKIHKLTLSKNFQLDKALDKVCQTLADMKSACDCYEFETCPFREKCSEGTNYCYNKDNWKEWAMKDLINDRDE